MEIVDKGAVMLRTPIGDSKGCDRLIDRSAESPHAMLGAADLGTTRPVRRTGGAPGHPSGRGMRHDGAAPARDAAPVGLLCDAVLTKAPQDRRFVVRPPAPMGASLAVSLHNIYETLAISAPTVADALLGRVSKSICDERLDRWSRACVRNARIALEVRGREHVGPRPSGVVAAASAGSATYLVMSNHQSLYDIPVLFQVVGPNIRMITKKELFGVPVFGGALEASGFIAIDRSNRNAAMRSLKRASDLLASGTHVWVAPEGTRSRSGELLPFKKGAFYLALEANLPILPVTLRGTRDVLPSNGWASRLGATVQVTVHEPIDPRSFSARGKPGRDELMALVRRVLESAL